MIEQALPIVGGIAGLSTLILGLLAYFKWKPKHPIEVKQAEVNIEAAKLKNEDQIIERYRAEFQRLTGRLDTLEKKQQIQLESHSRQEADCAAKIANLNRQIHELTEKIHRAENRCVDGCFSSNSR